MRIGQRVWRSKGGLLYLGVIIDHEQRDDRWNWYFVQWANRDPEWVRCDQVYPLNNKDIEALYNIECLNDNARQSGPRDV